MGVSRKPVIAIAPIRYYDINKTHNLTKIKKCNWCGKISSGRKTKNYWLCQRCENSRCNICSIILSNTRKCKNKACNEIHGQHEKGQKICLYCQNKGLSVKKIVDKSI